MGHPPREGGDGIAASPSNSLPGPARGHGSTARGPETILARAAALTAAELPFVIATVVAVRRPTSARPGARGIIHADRTIEGWVGGSCAQPIVIREALAALADGQPRLLRLSKEGRSERESVDGVIDHVMTCHSGGTLEIFVEPVLPAPALWIAGTTPVASALVTLGAATGYRVTIADPDALADNFTAASRVVPSSDLASLYPGAAPFAVVATQGQWDEEALEALLTRETEPAYVGLVTSPKRAESVREYLRGRGVSPERLARLHAPAGLDIGAANADEIALSILAELVTLRRRGGVRPLVAVGPGRPAEEGMETSPLPSRPRNPIPDDIVLRDPVCGMTVDREDIRYISKYGGTTYAFCRLPCRTEFLRDPDAYVPAAPAAR